MVLVCPLMDMETDCSVNCVGALAERAPPGEVEADFGRIWRDFLAMLFTCLSEAWRFLAPPPPPLALLPAPPPRLLPLRLRDLVGLDLAVVAAGGVAGVGGG